MKENSQPKWLAIFLFLFPHHSVSRAQSAKDEQAAAQWRRGVHIGAVAVWKHKIEVVVFSVCFVFPCDEAVELGTRREAHR